MSDPKDTPMFGCLYVIWSFIGLAIQIAINATMWYLVLCQIEATATLWALYFVYVPVASVVGVVSLVLGQLKKLEEAA